jgi:hypothetical protein
VFIAFDTSSIGQAESSARLADQIIEHFRSAAFGVGESVQYPGEPMLQV